MRYVKLLALMLVFVLMAAMPALGAAYMKLGDIKGESQDDGHKDWIIIESFSHEMSAPRNGATGATRRRGSASIGDFVVSKEIDKSTPKLQEALVTGKVLPELNFELTRDFEEGRQAYLQYELKNVLVSSYQISGDADDRPTEEVAFNFEEIKVTYTYFARDGSKGGSVEFEWKVEKGTK